MVNCPPPMMAGRGSRLPVKDGSPLALKAGLT
jgi:hypothetical protein